MFCLCFVLSVRKKKKKRDEKVRVKSRAKKTALLEEQKMRGYNS